MFGKHTGRFLGGAAVGAANGLFGGGGGMIAVPLLERAGLPTRRAHATAIAVVLPATLAGGLVYALGGLAPLAVLLPVALGVFFGGICGARLLSVLPAAWVDALFGLFMLAAGVRMML